MERKNKWRASGCNEMNGVEEVGGERNKAEMNRGGWIGGEDGDKRRWIGRDTGGKWQEGLFLSKMPAMKKQSSLKCDFQQRRDEK